MSRLTVAVLLLSFLAVAHSRLIEPDSEVDAAAVADDREPPKPAAAQSSDPELPSNFVTVPVHRLADLGVLGDVGFSLRLPNHGRRHPCGGVQGRRWWAHRHHDGLLRPRAVVGKGLPGEARGSIAATILRATYELESKRGEVAEPDPDSDNEGEMGNFWKKVRKVMMKRSHHGEHMEVETEKRWKEMKSRFHHGHRRHHRHAKEGGMLKWIRDLVHF